MKPITKPPIDSDIVGGKPSDHLLVLFHPLPLVQKSRLYRTVEFRPLSETGLAKYGAWLKEQNWTNFYQIENVDMKAEFLHESLKTKFHEIFPLKQIKLSSNDKPWFNEKLKKID